MNAKTSLEFGDQVRHVDRPEWGVGSVAKVEVMAENGTTSQRLTIRFPNAGIKVLDSVGANLERIDPTPAGLDEGASPEMIDQIDRMSEDDLLAPVATRKLTEIMVAIPEPCRDPFRSLADRIESTLALWRFDDGGRGLNDWAVMQTGLDDPLARFNRHELEEHFKRWSHEREQHLRRLIFEASDDSIDIGSLIAAASPEAQRVARRFCR